MTTHDGLIPARAGNTEGYVTAPSPSWAHPRSRGEHHFSVSFRCRFGGSSPLARGTLLSVFNRVREKGLIPARAGNTPRLRTTRLRSWAHPRSRGEHSVVCKSPWTSKGSSPLARGTHETQRKAIYAFGLIPARAGNTHPRKRGRRRRRAHPRSRGEHAPPSMCVLLGWAHPRSRGEHTRAALSRLRLRGSSPLARGTRSRYEC